ncbi:MAG: 2-amino-4-hydroxy-6-hydroxymethyldihydropteridine diphosphokinase [Firmicutes bacterium]|nr:2-amino-4-hydroxy-6-hydroxymethyldihydropteridine diphosphokinase [Bacillota bacterium]
MDKIFIDKLQVFGRHGVMSEENTLGQMFYISAELSLSLRGAGCTDELEKTVDYGECCHLIKSICENNTYKLIETLAENIAAALLKISPLVTAVRLRVDKPSAPIGLPLAGVGVEIERKWNTAYIALGSNMGDREKYLTDAVKAVDSDENCRVTRVSPFIETKPVSDVPQDDYLNGCMAVQTLYSPQELLDMLNAAEAAADRKRTVKWGPRTLDLDIIFYGDEIIQTKSLTVPHPLMHTRAFVLEPLNAIAPYMRHPVFGLTVGEMLKQLTAAP